MWLTIATTALITTVVVAGLMLLLLNLKSSEKHLTDDVEPEPVEDEQFMRSLGGLLAPAFTPGNHVELLVNGDLIFPAMLEAIDHAQKTITFETFIYWKGDIAVKFAEAFCRAARRGVEVNCMLDWLGSKPMDHELIERMEAAGCRVVRYHPPEWYTLHRTNHRTHRKILVVDGHIGFTGGVGVAQEWCGDGPRTGNIRDNHFRLRGPIVSQLQGAFMDNWLKSRQAVLHGEKYFPDGTAGGQTGNGDNTTATDNGDYRAMLFQSSPDHGSESLRLMYLFAIRSAARSIRLSAAYFIPDDLTRKDLSEAALRGVRVQIIVPDETIDKPIVRYVSRERWEPLLRAGVEIREYKGCMYHVKGIIIDDVFVSVGSGNFDNRSFRMNDEANVLIYDTAFARLMSESFEDDLANSQLQTLEMWHRRPAWQRLYGRFGNTFRSQL